LFPLCFSLRAHSQGGPACHQGSLLWIVPGMDVAGCVSCHCQCSSLSVQWTQLGHLGPWEGDESVSVLAILRWARASFILYTLGFHALLRAWQLGAIHRPLWGARMPVVGTWIEIGQWHINSWLLPFLTTRNKCITCFVFCFKQKNIPDLVTVSKILIMKFWIRLPWVYLQMFAFPGTVWTRPKSLRYSGIYLL
jgi:hypothetical protein